EGAEPGAFGAYRFEFVLCRSRPADKSRCPTPSEPGSSTYTQARRLWMAIAVETRAPVTVEPEAAPSVADAIVEATGVDKIYDTGKVQVQALRSISFAVHRGEMVAIMGPSGSGKTTLLNCLSGLDRIDGGEVAIEGVPLSAMSDEERTDYRAKRMGFVFQFYNLMPVLTSVENVELPLLVARVPAKEARRKALEALDLVGLRERATHVPDELS